MIKIIIKRKSFFWVKFSLFIGLFYILSFSLRPLLPVDETRYLSVAWEMWQRGDFLVPYLNGQPYAHKPPLLFWLIHISWALFGVSEWAARGLFALLSLIGLFLTAILARQVHQNDQKSAGLLFGSVLWLLLSSLVQFDVLLTLCHLSALIALFKISQGQNRYWSLYALSLGLGLLGKGPIILLHSLPIALLAPLWTKQNWRRWYVYLIISVLAAVFIALLWAVPAALSGGQTYARSIFWDQTAHRIVHSFAHQKAWWWYMVWIPILLLPWTPFIRWRTWPWNSLVLNLICSLILLSLISGKQTRYLLPLWPLLAILLSDHLTLRRQAILIYVLIATVITASLPYWPVHIHWWVNLSAYWGGAVLILGLLIAIGPGTQWFKLAVFNAIWILILQAQFFQIARPAYDLHALAQLIQSVQKQGHQVAHFGKYHGQFHFLGRLDQALIPLSSQTLFHWAKNHPDDYIVYYAKNDCRPRQAIWHQDYRGRSNALFLIQGRYFSCGSD